MPAAALAVGGGMEEGEAPTAPAQGDKVSAQIDGTVTRVEGDNVYFTPETANGQPIPDMAKGPGMGTEDDDASIEAMMKEEAL